MNEKEFDKMFWEEIADEVPFKLNKLWQWIEEYAIEMCNHQKALSINQLREVYSDGIKPLVNIIKGTPLPKELIK